MDIAAGIVLDARPEHHPLFLLFVGFVSNFNWFSSHLWRMLTSNFLNAFMSARDTEIGIRVQEVTFLVVMTRAFKNLGQQMLFDVYSQKTSWAPV